MRYFQPSRNNSNVEGAGKAVLDDRRRGRDAVTFFGIRISWHTIGAQSIPALQGLT